VDGQEVNAKDVIFDWLAQEVHGRDLHERRDGGGGHGWGNEASRFARTEDPAGHRHSGHLARDRIPLETGVLFHREGSEEAEAFVETYLRKLLEGKVTRVIGGIRQMATKRGDLSKAKWENLEQCLNYFAERREYMKYDEYLTAGYPIGSGVVEGACRHLVKDRMEQTGMRWRIAGAQAILTLRAIYVNDDWEAFHGDRIHTEQRKLYPYKNRLNAILNCAA